MIIGENSRIYFNSDFGAHVRRRHVGPAPWFADSRKSRTGEKADWYLWADAAANGGPPNNWLSRVGGSAWSWDETRKQFYYHSFLAAQPDLNWRNAEVRAAMCDVIRFWLDREVDGLWWDEKKS
jgi:alpha-glucosidase